MKECYPKICLLKSYRLDFRPDHPSNVATLHRASEECERTVVREVCRCCGIDGERVVRRGEDPGSEDKEG